MALNLYRVKYEHLCGISEKMADKIDKHSMPNEESLPFFFMERKDIPKGLKGVGVKTAEDYVIL